MSQNLAMLAILKNAGGEWVSKVVIGQAIHAWAIPSRASDLRKLGYVIENKVKVGADGQKLSWYRLVVEAGGDCKPTGSQAQPVAHPPKTAAGRHHSAAPVAGVPLAGTQCDQESFEWEAFDGDRRGGIPD